MRFKPLQKVEKQVPGCLAPFFWQNSLLLDSSGLHSVTYVDIYYVVSVVMASIDDIYTQN